MSARRRGLRRYGVALAVLVALLLRPVPAPACAEPGAGTLILVGDILRFNHPVLWERILKLAGGGLADLVVIGAANEKSRLYAGFAKRAFERYGAFVQVLPVAVDPNDFSVSYQAAVSDPASAELVRSATGVFFVGGAPQRLAGVLLNEDGSPTPLARAVCDMFASGGVLVGGIPGASGIRTGIDAMSVLDESSLDKTEIHHGFGLMPRGWYADQNFFSHGRFAETLVAMHQLGMPYGLGVGANTAAVVAGRQVDVVGDEGVMVVDLSRARVSQAPTGGFALEGARLSYLDDGDRYDIEAQKAIVHAAKLEGFALAPTGSRAPASARPPPVDDMFARGRILELMQQAIDADAGEASGFAIHRDGGGGYRFRFRSGPDSRGWMSESTGSLRYTILNIDLDVIPVTAAEVEALR